MLKKKLGFIVFLILFILFNTASTSANSDWWNTSWTYRQRLNITNNDVQNLKKYHTINFTFDTASLIYSGKLQDDCDDLRIVYNDVELNMTIHNSSLNFMGNYNGCNDGNTMIYFMLQDDITSFNDSYYVYYGNPSATKYSNDLEKIFLLYDDFERPDSDTLGNDWNEVAGDVDINSGRLYSPTTNNVGAYKNFDVGLLTDVTGFEVFVDYFMSSSNSAGYLDVYIKNVTDAITALYSYNKITYMLRDMQEVSRWSIAKTPPGTTCTVPSYIKCEDYTISLGSLYRTRWVHYDENGDFSLWVNDTKQSWDTLNNTDVSSNKTAGVYVEFNRYYSYIDNILIKRYINTQPTIEIGNGETFENYIVLTLETPKNTSYSYQNISINGSTNIFGNITFSIDDGANQTACLICTNFQNYTVLSSGTHNIIVYAMNSSNSSDVDYISRVFTIDLFPNVTLYSPYNGSVVSNPVVFQFIPIDDVSLSKAELYVNNTIDLINESWSTGAQIPEARGDTSCTVVKQYDPNVFFCIGGVKSGNNPSAANYMYNTTSNTWTEKTSRPIAAWAIATASNGTHIFVWGGRNTTQAVTNLDIYNPVTNSWTSGSPENIARYGHTSIYDSNNNKFYIIGGMNTTTQVNDVYMYDPVTDSYTVKAKMPYNASYTTNGYNGTHIFILTGYSEGVYHAETNLTQIYSISNDAWSLGAEAPVKKYGSCVGDANLLVNDLIWVSHGIEDTVASSTLYVYNITNNSWAKKSDAPYTIDGPGCALVGTKIYKIAGTKNTIYYTYNQILNIEKWYIEYWLPVNSTTSPINDSINSLMYNFNYGANIKWNIKVTDSANQMNFAPNNWTLTVPADNPPQYSLNSTNSTIAGTAVSHSLFWQDESGLSHYLFSFDNCTGSLVNDTIIQYFNHNFNQEKTSNITGYNTTSAGYMNQQDGQFYNVTMVGSEEFQVQKVSYYNLSDSTNNKAYWASPAGRVPWGGTEATAQQYTNMSIDDGTYAEVHADATNDEPYWRFNFTINENIADINWVYMAFNGYENAAETATCYYYNYTDSGWYSIGIVPDTDGTISVNKTNGFNDMINNNNKQLIIYCEGANYDDTSPPWDSIFTDFVEVRVGYHVAEYYRAEVEHNTTLSYNGNLINLTVFVNFLSNVSSTYNLTIYNFNTGTWDYSKCSNGTVTANQFNYWNCTITENVLNYNNSNNEVSIRLNQTTTSTTQGQVSIDYVNFKIIEYEYVPNYIAFGSLEGWSNVTKIINSTVGCTIRWCVYANDTSNNWNGTSCQNPFSYVTTSAGVIDATFSIALPSDYTSWNPITGETEETATSIDWISFNFTDIPENFRQPYQLGNSNYNQNGGIKPIFYIDATGNTDIDIKIKFSSELPNGIVVGANSTCSGTYTSCQSQLQNIGTTYVLLVDDLSQTNSFANITLYANLSSGTAPTGSGFTLYIYGVD